TYLPTLRRRGAPRIFPYTTLFRSEPRPHAAEGTRAAGRRGAPRDPAHPALLGRLGGAELGGARRRDAEVGLEDGAAGLRPGLPRSEEHTSELQSPDHLVCRLLLEK